MKRIINSLLALSLIATGTVSCQKEILSPSPQEGQEVAVNIDLTTPLMGTKAYADGTTVDVVRVHVYQQDAEGNLTYIAPNETTPTPSKDVYMTDGSANYSTRLVTGQTYTFVFWAEKKANGAYTYDPATKTISVDYTDASGNDENRDAFYNVLKDVTITGAYSASVQLHRPFAQLNFGASDYDAAVAAGITVTGAAVKLTNVANSLNLLDGSVSGTETVTFANATLPSETLSAANKSYKYVAMDYVLVGKDAKTLSDVTLTLAVTGTTSTTPEYTYTSVPLQGNYRTNIVGSLFTSPADIQITVDPAFNTPDENVVVENVASIAAANEALENGATSINITNVTTSEAGTTNLQMPATAESITVTVENIESTANLQIEQPASGASPASVSVTLPASASVENLTINLPESHVEVNGATTYNSITATTSDNTLVIGADVKKVNTLTVKAGSVEIYGRVNNVVKEEGAGEIKVWTVYTVAQLQNAVKATKNVVLGGNISALAQIVLNNDGAEVDVDLNGYKITKYSAPLKIQNAKVNFIGTGTISASTNHVIQIVGSGTDVADYTVVSIGPDVTVSNGNGSTWGILIDKDAAGTYKNYGIVLNIEGSIVTRDNGGAGAITINGSNTNTSGNVPVINFNGATVKFGKLGIYAAGYAKWNLTNADIEGEYSAIEARSGEVTINGGDYKSTYAPFKIEANGSGNTVFGAALGISQHTTDLPVNVVVNDGTFTGEYAIYEKDVQNLTACDQIKLTVNGGTFNGAIYSQNNPNCLVKGTYSDPSALNYLANNADVKIDVKQDVTSGFFTLPADANAEIALNGNSVTFTAASETGHGSKIYGDLVIKGSGYIGDPTHETVGYLFDMYGNSTLLVEGDATIECGLSCIQLSDNAHATVKGGKWIGGEYGEKYWTINKIDSSKDSAVVEVMGGEFYKFDPSNSATENPVQNWVPEGYTVTLENDWYKVTAQ